MPVLLPRSAACSGCSAHGADAPEYQHYRALRADALVFCLAAARMAAGVTVTVLRFTGHLQVESVDRYRPEQRPTHLLRFGMDLEVICASRLGNTLWFLGHPDAATRAAVTRRAVHPPRTARRRRAPTSRSSPRRWRE